MADGASAGAGDRAGLAPAVSVFARVAGDGEAEVIPAITTAEELLTESQAAARIPGRRSDVVEWLRGLGISRKGPTGVRVYRLSEVLASAGNRTYCYEVKK